MFGVTISQKFIQDSVLPFAKSAAAISVINIFMTATRTPQLPQGIVKHIRRATTIFVTPLSHMYFSKTQFDRHNLPYLLFFFHTLNFLNQYKSSVSLPISSDTINEVKQSLETVKELLFYRKIQSFFTINNKHLPQSVVNIYNDAVITPVLEELFYRLVLQEGLLRQLPKFLAGRFSVNISVDHPIFQISRIIASAFIFAISHDSRMFSKTFISGLTLGYEKERLGLCTSILSHFSSNLYVALDKVR